MSNEERIRKIEEFIHAQRYLHGLRFRVVEGEGDGFIIEFESASDRQIKTLNHRLRNYEMTHIRPRAMKIIPFEHKKKRK